MTVPVQQWAFVAGEMSPDTFGRVDLSKFHLGAYFSNALSRDKDQLAQQTGIVRGAVEAARAQNANEGSPTADLRVDWMSIRQSSGGWGYPSNSANGMWFGAGYDELSVPGGLRF